MGQGKTQISRLSQMTTPPHPTEEWINQRIDSLVAKYLATDWVAVGGFASVEGRRVHDAFYSERAHYEDMLDGLTRPTAPTEASTTTAIFSAYQPHAPKRKRGRPPTGGRKPRDRRVNKDDDSF